MDNIPDKVQKRAKEITEAAVDMATRPKALARMKAVLKSIDQSTVGAALAQRVDQGLVLAVQAADLKVQAAKKRLRLVGAAEAVGGSIALIVLLTIIAFAWQHEDWHWILTDKPVIAIAVGLSVSAGLIITGIRTLFTARG